MKKRNSSSSRYGIGVVAVALLAVFIGCSQATDPGPTGPAPEDTILDYENDTMEQVYSDEWTAETGDTTFVLKDNTFLLDDGETGIITAGRVVDASVSQSATGSMSLETTMIYLQQDSFGDISDSLDFSEVNEYASLLALFGGPFDPPESAFTFNEWVTEEQFAQQYEATNQAYAESYIEYIEQIYSDLGYDISSMIPEWDSLTAELFGEVEADPTTLDGYFETPQYNYEIFEEPQQNRRRFMGDGINQDWSFISDIPTGVTYATP